MWPDAGQNGPLGGEAERRLFPLLLPGDSSWNLPTLTAAVICLLPAQEKCQDKLLPIPSYRCQKEGEITPLLSPLPKEPFWLASGCVPTPAAGVVKGNNRDGACSPCQGVPRV